MGKRREWLNVKHLHWYFFSVTEKDHEKRESLVSGPRFTPEIYHIHEVGIVFDPQRRSVAKKCEPTERE